EGPRGWVRNISGDTLVQGLKRTVGKIDCLLFNNCNLSRNFRALSQVASVTVRFLAPSSGIDIAPFVARGFFSSLRGKRDFHAAATDFTSTLEGEEQFRQIKAEVVLEEPDSDRIDIDSGDALYTVDEMRMPDLARDKLQGAFEASEPIDDKGPRTYRVWYGTNRRPVSADSAGITYGSERDT